jgi:uncharacterized protein YdeI (YjbR/CyaY-like superfamily)
MVRTDPRIDAYIAQAATFAQPILRRIREQVHAACPDVVEDVKWGFPHFLLDGRILCSMAGFKAHCAFGFWDRAEVRGMAARDGAMGQFGRIQSLSDLPAKAAFDRLLRQAAALRRAGKPAGAPKVSGAGPSRTAAAAVEVPAALAEALRAAPTALAHFQAFSPSRRREYSEWIAEARTEATRARRLAQAVEWIAAGKSRNWKYERPKPRA